jgi:hypothetical protein
VNRWDDRSPSRAWWQWRLALAWHRHQLAHRAWQLLVAIDSNDVTGAGLAILGYDVETRIIHDLELAGL